MDHPNHNKRRLGVAEYEHFFDGSEELGLEFPDPLFMKREYSESSSLGYREPSELNLDRFPRRVDSLDNMRASPV